MSALVLCRECYSWAEPRGDACPVCRGTLDVDQPDPTPEQLRDAIGRVERCLGEVATPRKLLPDRGLLHLTTGGLLFLPHDVSRLSIPAADWSPWSTLLWGAAAVVWSPLAVAGAVVRLRAAGPREVVVPVPRRLALGDDVSPAALLMDDPGAFFIPRGRVRLVHRTWRGWVVECSDRGAVRFRPREPAAFAAGLEDAACGAGWVGVVTA